MNNEDNVYELLGNVQVLTKEGVETKFEELEASLPQKINDALGTSLDEKIDEAVSNAVIDVGGVTPALLDEVKAELVATDTALQAADTALSERITVLENAEPSGGTGDVTTEMLNEVKTELENADTALSERVTALEAGGGSGGSTTDELLVLTLDVDIDDITDTAAWLLKEVINFDTLYQSYLTKTNKPVVINIGMSDDTGSTQYSFRDVITSADNTQIRITGDAMSAAIVPNLRFTIDLVLIKDEATGNCTINTTESKFLMQEDTGGSSGEAVPEKIFEFTGEYLVDATAELPTFTVNIDAIDSDKFKEAVEDSYKFQLCLRAPQTALSTVITAYMYAIQGANYVFLFNLDSLGMVPEKLYGRVKISVMQNEETGNYELGTYGTDKGYDDSLNLVTLDKRVTALEENGSGGGDSTDDKNLIIKLDVISPEALDEGIAISNLRFAEETNFNDLFEKARTGGYNVTVNLIVGKDDSSTVYYSAKPVNLQISTESTEGKPYIFCDVIFDLGGEVLTNFIFIKSDMNGNCILESGPDADKFQTAKLASDTAVNALAERVTALEENGSGGGDSTDDLDSYTYIIDSQEKFDAFCTATNATETDGNDYSHVYIKNGDYTQATAIKIDNTAVPVLSITGESKEGVVITYRVHYTNAAFSCTLLRQDSDELPEVICTVQNCTFMYAHANTSLFLTQAYNYQSNVTDYSYTPINFFNCILNTTSTFSCLNLAQCTVNINFKYKDSSSANSCACILCEQAIDTTIVYNQEASESNNYILYGLRILKDKNTMCKNVNVIVEQLKEHKTLHAIAYFNTCIDCTCTLAINQTNMVLVGHLNMSNSTSVSYISNTGFYACANLTNCTALHFNTGFLDCTNLTNCTALFKYMYFYKSVTLDQARTNCGFEMCHNLTNCNVATSNHDVTTNNTKANELLNKNKKSLLIDGTASVKVKTLYAGFYACENLINCHDNIDNIIHICKYASLTYYSFVSCTYVQGCSANLKYIYITNNLINEGTWSIYPYYMSHYLTQNGLVYATNSTDSFGEITYIQKLNVIDYRQSTSTSLPTKIYFTYISGCNNVSNMYLDFEAKSSTSLGTSLFNIRACYKVKNVTNSDIKVATTTGTKNADSQLTGVHNCVLYSPETSTCSASQTYAADYAVADTPAGGFNKIVS